MSFLSPIPRNARIWECLVQLCFLVSWGAYITGVQMTRISCSISRSMIQKDLIGRKHKSRLALTEWCFELRKKRHLGQGLVNLTYRWLLICRRPRDRGTTFRFQYWVTGCTAISTCTTPPESPHLSAKMFRVEANSDATMRLVAWTTRISDTSLRTRWMQRGLRIT